MRRVRQLVDEVQHRYPGDHFFDRFAESCAKNPGKLSLYRTYEDAFRWLDPTSWETLKQKAVAHFRDHRPGQLKQGFFNQLNDAFAYRHLARRGCDQVRILPETGQQVPDLEYFEGRVLRGCEVKTLGVSDEEISRRDSREAFANVYLRLSEGFFNKLRGAIAAARSQIEAHSGQGLVYLVIIPDDFALDNYRSYRRELALFARADNVENVHIRFGLQSRLRMRLKGRLTIG